MAVVFLEQIKCFWAIFAVKFWPTMMWMTCMKSVFPPVHTGVLNHRCSSSHQLCKCCNYASTNIWLPQFVQILFLFLFWTKYIHLFNELLLIIKYLACVQSTYDMLYCSCDGTQVKCNIIIILTDAHFHVKQVVPQRSVWNRRRDRFEDPRRPWQLPGPTQQEECWRFLPVC